MSITAQEFARAFDRGQQAARGNRSQAENPWKHSNTQDGRTLRDQWDDGFLQARGKAA